MVIKRLMLVLGSVALLAVFSLAADQTLQSGGGMMGCNFDFSKTISMEGTVKSVAMARGQGFPHFVLALEGGGEVTVVTAPFWAVLNANYQIGIGDVMSVVAFPSTQKDVFGAAVLENHSNGESLTLRDASGAPVANAGQGNGRGRGGRGNGNCWNCPNR
jgi:hypothetical protein